MSAPDHAPCSSKILLALTGAWPVKGVRDFGKLIEPGIFLLASGKPAAIAEVLRIVERVEDRRLYVRFERQASNADHMSFVPSALPANWWPTDLDTGIRLTARQLRGSVQVA